MQEQNLEEWKEKIDRSAEQITVPDTLTPGAVQQMLEERKNRTSAGRKEHRHYRRFAGIAAAVAVLVIAVGTYGWNKYGTDDAQPKKAALSVTETVDSTQDTEKLHKSFCQNGLLARQADKEVLGRFAEQIHE